MGRGDDVRRGLVLFTRQTKQRRSLQGQTTFRTGNFHLPRAQHAMYRCLLLHYILLTFFAEEGWYSSPGKRSQEEVPSRGKPRPGGETFIYPGSSMGSDPVTYSSVQQYLHFMSQPHAYATNIELIAASQLYHVDFRVVTGPSTTLIPRFLATFLRCHLLPGLRALLFATVLYHPS